MLPEVVIPKAIIPHTCSPHALNQKTQLTLPTNTNEMLTGSISVGKQPAPTRVKYAFTTPYMSVTTLGGIPSPVKTPPIEQLDDVTIG